MIYDIRWYFCANYLKRRKLKVERQRHFHSVRDLDVAPLKKLLDPEGALQVHEGDSLHQNSFWHFKKGNQSLQLMVYSSQKKPWKNLTQSSVVLHKCCH